MSPPLLPQDITMTETEETVLHLEAVILDIGGVARLLEGRLGDGDAFCRENTRQAAETCRRVQGELDRHRAALSRAPEAGREEVQARDVMKGLHRWLEWDFPTARQEYEAGAQHVLDAISPLPVEPYLPPEETFSAWRERVNQMRDDGSLPGEKTPRRLPPPSTGGEGEALIMRVGERIADEVEKVAAGRQSNCEQAARDIVGWLKPSQEAVAIKTVGWAALAQNQNIRLWSADFDTVHAFAMFNGCEVVRLVSPSPEMGEISREWLARTINPWAFAIGHGYQVKELQKLEAYAKADAILSKLKENGLSREELGGSSRASRGAAGPSDCAEGDARLSDGGANPSDGSGA